MAGNRVKTSEPNNRRGEKLFCGEAETGFGWAGTTLRGDLTRGKVERESLSRERREIYLDCVACFQAVLFDMSMAYPISQTLYAAVRLRLFTHLSQSLRG